MSYIEHNLSPKEKLIFRPKIHWFVLVNGPLLMVAGYTLHSEAWVQYTGKWISHSNGHKVWYVLNHYDLDDVIELGVNLLPVLAILLGLWLLIVGVYRKMGIDMGITSRRVVIKDGLFHTDTQELSFSDIESITIHQSPFGKFLDYGEVVFSGISFHSAHKREIVFRWVENPSKARRVALAGLDAYAPAPKTPL